MTPELKLAFQQKVYELHINSSMGVDEKNIDKLIKICDQLYNIAEKLCCEIYPDDTAKTEVTMIKPENDVTEATAELSARVKAHRPESK